jgi:hypothetical protein
LVRRDCGNPGFAISFVRPFVYRPIKCLKIEGQIFSDNWILRRTLGKVTNDTRPALPYNSISIQDVPAQRQSAFLAQQTLKKFEKEKRVGAKDLDALQGGLKKAVESIPIG